MKAYYYIKPNIFDLTRILNQSKYSTGEESKNVLRWTRRWIGKTKSFSQNITIGTLISLFLVWPSLRLIERWKVLYWRPIAFNPQEKLQYFVHFWQVEIHIIHLHVTTKEMTKLKWKCHLCYHLHSEKKVDIIHLKYKTYFAYF